MRLWIEAHRVLLYWLTGTSIVLFFTTLFLVPVLVARIPHDYFMHAHRPPSKWATRHRVVRLLAAIGKNVLGYVCIALGIAMLVLPGQGLLTMVIGILMVDFPGKYNLEKWIASRPQILKPINWLRRRRNCAPLKVHSPERRRSSIL
jgi:hypothetical protein